MLHITNGDIAADLIRETGISGDVLPWRDVLHEGPVPEGLYLRELSRERASYIAEQGWAKKDEALRQFVERDDRITASAADEEVVLWFEHDLYDQLQLIQILSLYASELPAPAKLTIICIDSYPGVDGFKGLGMLTSEQLFSLFPGRQEVSAAAFKSAVAAWSLFRRTSHTELREFAAEPCEPLPFLPAALHRMLEEHPSPRDGLSRTERQILTVARAGPATATVLFRLTQQLETAPYIGDGVFFKFLRRLAGARHPALSQLPALHLGLTPFGSELLDGGANWIVKNGIDRWVGGVRFYSE